MTKSKAENKFFAKSLFIGALSSIAASIILLILFSVFMLIQQMPQNGGFYISFVIVCLAAMTGGFIGTGIMRCKGMFTGALVGLIYIVLIALIGAAAGFAVNIFGTFILKALLAVVFGGLGGIIKMNLRRR